MIFTQRTAAPDFYGTRSVRNAVERSEVFFSRPKQARLQERFEFISGIWKDAHPALAEMFHGKCAYCESSLSESLPGEVELFRPKVEAVGLIPTKARLKRLKDSAARKAILDEADQDGYWWLAYDWENHYLACEYCNRNKRNQFPVIGKRAVPGTRGKALRDELALLLDPCFDRPENYLFFKPDGSVCCRKPLNQEEFRRFEQKNRGAITIDVLGLNRSDLVKARRLELHRLRQEWRLMTSTRRTPSDRIATLESMVDVKKPFAGMRLQFLNLWRAAYAERTPAPLLQRLDELLQPLLPDLSKFPRKRFSAKRARRVVVGKTLSAKKKKAGLRRQKSAGFIKRIRIQDFRAIRDLTIHMPPGNEDRIGWKVLLGENGSSKSSILQAVAFALMGPNFLRRHLRDFKLKPVDLLRKVQGTRTVSSASVLIEFSTGKKSTLKFTRKRFEYFPGPPPRMFVRGYGATRLLPRRNAPRVRVRRGIPAIVSNLFDPAKPVFNAEGWLVGLKSHKDFGSAALSLKDLLNLQGFTKLRIASGKIIIPSDGLNHSLDELSAGYESILVMAADIMAGLMGTVRDFRHAPGIVLLDEIDAHLHPRWKMRIVESLRRTFPSMQFLVTTHEPLCLRGIKKGEVSVLERVGKNISIFDELPDPSTMRVDQLLTSNFFGLGCTIDPVLEEQFNYYYSLLAQDKLTATRARDRDRLRKNLLKYEHRLMADDPREEIIYEAVDEYVAKDSAFRGKNREKLPALRKETKNRVVQLLKSLDEGGTR